MLKAVMDTLLYWDDLLWIVLYISSVAILYQFGLKHDWYRARNLKSLSRCDYQSSDDAPISMFERNHYGVRLYIFPCCLLILISAVITLIIYIIIYQTTGSTFVFSSFKADAQGYLLLVLIYSHLLGISPDIEKIEAAELRGVLNVTFGLIAKIKANIINLIVLTEVKNICKIIDKQLTLWFSEWGIAVKNIDNTKYIPSKDAPKLGVLLKTLDGDYFKKILPKATPVEFLDRFNSFKSDLISGYAKSTVNLTELKKLFKIDMINAGITYPQIGEVFYEIKAFDQTEFKDIYAWYIKTVQDNKVVEPRDQMDMDTFKKRINKIVSSKLESKEPYDGAAN